MSIKTNKLFFAFGVEGVGHKRKLMDKVMDKLRWADEVLDGVDLNEELNEDDD